MMAPRGLPLLLLAAVAATGDRRPFMQSAAYHGFAAPFPVFLPTAGDGTRAAKVQVVDALFDHDHGHRVAFVTKDPKPGAVLPNDRHGHGNRSWNYRVPADATCVFETGSGTVSSNLTFGFTDVRFYNSGDIWLCPVPVMLDGYAVLRLRIDLGSGGAVRLTSSTWDQQTEDLDAAVTASRGRSERRGQEEKKEEMKKERNAQTMSDTYEIKKRMAVEDGYGSPPQAKAKVTMCIKPVYNTHSILHKLPIFIEYHLGVGVEHFLFYKQPAMYEPLTSEGMLGLAPYIHKGVVTVLELHPRHADSGIAQSGVYDGGDNINAEALVGTHCAWHTRGKTQWTFVHIDVDEWWTPLPFDTTALHRTLDTAYADSVRPPLALNTKHITAQVPQAPSSPINMTTMAANPDNRYGKHIYRPELVNVAWVHEAANTAADNGVLHPSGTAYRSAHINEYRTGTPHETYFVHFSPSHWKEEAAKHTRKHPNEKFPTRQFEYPADFRGKVLNGIRESILAAL